MALIPPFFSDAVVAIGYDSPNGGIVYGASGFFYFHTIKGDVGHVYLVTNKHVVNGRKSIYLRVNPAAGSEPTGYKLNLIDPATGDQLWSGHYRKHVDVAVVLVNFTMLKHDNMQVAFFSDKKHALSTKQMIANEVTEGDGVFAIGFPVSLVGDKSNSVLVRGGTIARIRDTLRSPTEPYLIDSTVFPGNSGGPIVNKPELVSIQGTKTIDAASLIGIVAAYVPYRDVAVSRQTQNVRVVFEENSGLSYVYSVDCIQTTIRSHERNMRTNAKSAEPKISEKALELPKDFDVDPAAY